MNELWSVSIDYFGHMNLYLQEKMIYRERYEHGVYKVYFFLGLTKILRLITHNKNAL